MLEGHTIKKNTDMSRRWCEGSSPFQIECLDFGDMLNKRAICTCKFCFTSLSNMKKLSLHEKKNYKKLY